MGPPRWRRGSELDFGSEDLGSILRLSSPRVGPLMARSKRRLQTSRCPCRGRLGTLMTPSCPWRWVPDSRSKFRNLTYVLSLYSWNIAECDVKPQSTTTSSIRWHAFFSQFLRIRKRRIFSTKIRKNGFFLSIKAIDFLFLCYWNVFGWIR